MAIFVYGSYSTEIDSFRPKGTVCPNCDATDQIEIHKVIDVIHFMYAPIIPTRIENIIHCHACGYEFSIKGLNKESKKYWKSFKSKKWTPIWFFSGPIFIVLIFAYSSYSQFKNENEMLERLQSGNQNQIIEYEMENGSFSTMKTIKINDNEVWLFYNNFHIEDYKFIDRITGNQVYSSDTSKVDLQNIKDLINDGKVKFIYPQ